MRGAASSFEASVEAALVGLSSADDPGDSNVRVEPVIDGVSDPVGAAAALQAIAVAASPGGDAGETPVAALVLRVAPPLDGAAPGYAPTPLPPAWVRIRAGTAEVSVSPLASAAPAPRTVRRVEVEFTSQRCCDSSSCDAQKSLASAWLVVDGGATEERFLVAEVLDRGPVAAALVGDVAARLAEATGATLVTSELDRDGAPPMPPPLPPVSATGLARFGLRREGARTVLRDHAGSGPRATSRRTALYGGALLVPALVLWAVVAEGVAAGRPAGGSVAAGAVATVLSLAAYAFFGVARFSAGYRAASTALLSIGGGRFVVMPWVSRSGAVDLRAEGRLGAAIPVGELRGVEVTPRDGQVAVELDTDHGRIDVLVTGDVALAERWSAALRHVFAGASHAATKTSARQRARARAAAPERS